MVNIRFKTFDGEVFEVDIAIAKCFGTVRTMVDLLGTDDYNNEPVPIYGLSSALFKKIIEWVTYHKDDPPLPLPVYEFDDDGVPSDLSDWDAAFLNLNMDTLIEMVNAALYLDIMGLMDVSCRAIANIIKGKGYCPAEMRKAIQELSREVLQLQQQK